MTQETLDHLVDEVDAVLMEYAQRGVFQQYEKTRGRSAKTAFHFQWSFQQPYTILLDPEKRELSFPDLLPRIRQHSMMHRELKSFVQSREDVNLPEHRRVDPTRTVVKTRIERGILSISMTVSREEDVAYATRKLIQLVHETFMFLSEYWADYMWEHFQLNME